MPGKGKRQAPRELVEDEEPEQVYERVAGIDVAKASGVVCTRLPPVRDGGCPHVPCQGFRAKRACPLSLPWT
jgi:hypothetical protein